MLAARAADDPCRYVKLQVALVHWTPRDVNMPPPSPASVAVSVAIGPSPELNVTVTSASADIRKIHVVNAHAAAAPVPDRRPGGVPTAVSKTPVGPKTPLPRGDVGDTSNVQVEAGASVVQVPDVPSLALTLTTP